jgi:hypothetical protein
MSKPPTLVAQPDSDRVPFTIRLSMLSTADIEVTQGKILNMQSSIKALTGNDMSDGGIRVNVTAAPPASLGTTHVIPSDESSDDPSDASPSSNFVEDGFEDGSSLGFELGFIEGSDDGCNDGWIYGVKDAIP